jgi:hypothetical protein
MSLFQQPATLRDYGRITGKLNTSRRFVLPVRKAAAWSAVIAVPGRATIVIDGQGVERRPAIVMAPLRDFSQVLARRGFEMQQSGAFAKCAVRDKTGVGSGDFTATRSANFSVVIKQSLGKFLRFGAHRISLPLITRNQKC